ncbi:DUF7560 family zinc ribbon protein [Halarchaeum sp. P4]|uniref:DUF7560 family zinc ribbon protein n=1 Tax=Halarchaeum sp. P4 TaxID=3421639 RepID=UPI003EB91503
MMSRGEHRFRCPSCGESIVVDERMKRALLDAGCVLCQTPLTDADFTRLSGAPPEL